MNLKTAVVIFVLAILGVFATSSFLLIWTSNLLDQEAQEVVAANESVRIAKEIKTSLLIHNRSALLYSIYDDPERLQARQVQRTKISELIKEMSALIDSKEEEDIFSQVEQSVNGYFEHRDQLKASVLSPLEQYEVINKDVSSTIRALDMLIDINLVQSKALMANIHIQNKQASRQAVMLLIIGAIILLGAILMILTYVVRPLRSLSSLLEDYGAGNHSVRAISQGLKEVQKISKHFNLMADRLDTKQQEQLGFVASIAHDLRNPLNSMSLSAELLMDSDNKESRELSKLIFRQVESLDRLASDLQDTTQIESGQLDIELYTQEINTLVKNAIELHQPTSKIHKFKVKTQSEKIVCKCDSHRVSQVLNNLLSNAIKYSPNGGTVEINTQEMDSQVMISVKDQGIGIDVKDLDNIFKPFHRTKATKGTIPGIGLGLSASRRIVEAHKGTLTVESTNGSGSVFTVTLPKTMS